MKLEKSGSPIPHLRSRGILSASKEGRQEAETEVVGSVAGHSRAGAVCQAPAEMPALPDRPGPLTMGAVSAGPQTLSQSSLTRAYVGGGCP